MRELIGRLRRVSIRWKVVAIVLAVAFLSLILAGAGLLWQIRTTFELQTQQRLSLLADVVGLNSTAALAFNDPAAANETLAALGSDTHVMVVGLYDTDAKLFARYMRADLAREFVLSESTPSVGGWSIGGGQAAVMRTINYKGRDVGKVYLVADTNQFTSTLWRFVGITALLFSVVLVIGFFVSVWMQRIVTKPITDLADLARRVGQERDFGLRAVKHGDDELGTLVDGFNDMLDEIAAARGELEKAHDELEQRVLDRTAQLQAANKELEAFSYSVSHDLRAPLRAIDGFSRILLDDHGAALNADARASLDRVRRAAQRMGMLIDDLLKLASVTRTEPTPEDIDLSVLARDVLDTLQYQDPQRRVDAVLTPTLKVRGDARLLRIALENLLGNAWKFTGGQSQAKIELGMQVCDGTPPVYYVRDNGAGFDMAYASKLFAPFQRLHTAEQFPGTGIGLATVQRIVVKHGGRIWAEAMPDSGAAFYFTLEQGEAGHS
ncbi:MAG TPA: ATP-binding protein [Burkholderiales bacterium]|nr:ATP-binding protein [Burkholderiales bacterium]